MRRALTAGALLGFCGTTLAQSYPQSRMDYTISLRDGGGNSNGVVESGEVVHLRVTAEFTPTVGGLTWWYSARWGALGTVYGYAGSIIDVNGLESSATGSLAFAVPPVFNVGFTGTLTSTQSVMDSNSGQLVFLPLLPGSQANPVEIFTGTWTPADYVARTLRYGVSVDSGSIYLLVGLPQPVGETTINTGSQASIQIVPGPGVVAVAWLGIGIAGARRRRA